MPQMTNGFYLDPLVPYSNKWDQSTGMTSCAFSNLDKNHPIVRVISCYVGYIHLFNICIFIAFSVPGIMQDSGDIESKRKTFCDFTDFQHGIPIPNAGYKYVYSLISYEPVLYTGWFYLRKTMNSERRMGPVFVYNTWMGLERLMSWLMLCGLERQKLRHKHSLSTRKVFLPLF